MNNRPDYAPLFAFIEKYLPQGFLHINRNDPFLLDFENELRLHNQFFYIADLLKVKVLFTSQGSEEMLGIPPEEVDPFTFFKFALPDDHEKLNRAQEKLYKMGQELFIEQKGFAIVSIQLREFRTNNSTFGLLLQTYSFYAEPPANTTYTIILATELSDIPYHHQFHHYYAGKDISMFRYPDEALLGVGHIFSNRELDILRLIAAGMGSEQIASKLYLSVNTVNTHRRNILNKTGKFSTHDLVIELQEMGLL